MLVLVLVVWGGIGVKVCVCVRSMAMRREPRRNKYIHYTGNVNVVLLVVILLHYNNIYNNP